jgi:hypothetical protein
MPYQPTTSPNAELQTGMTPTPTTGHVNPFSHTLGGSLQDGGLQADSDRFNALTPHGVLKTALGGSQDDSSWELMQRAQGGYQPGSMTTMQDQINQGSDSE